MKRWRRGWDSNPRARFWQARRFRGAPVMTASVPLRQLENRNSKLETGKSKLVPTIELSAFSSQLSAIKCRPLAARFC